VSFFHESTGLLFAKPNAECYKRTAIEAAMRYYDELVKRIDKTMKAHPRRTVVMDADTFKVLATGRDAAKLSRKLKRERGRQARTVIFQQPDENAVWILRSLSKP
jgi:hypothetical protein